MEHAEQQYSFSLDLRVFDGVDVGTELGIRLGIGLGGSLGGSCLWGTASVICPLESQVSLPGSPVAVKTCPSTSTV